MDHTKLFKHYFKLYNNAYNSIQSSKEAIEHEKNRSAGIINGHEDNIKAKQAEMEDLLTPEFLAGLFDTFATCQSGFTKNNPLPLFKKIVDVETRYTVIRIDQSIKDFCFLAAEIERRWSLARFDEVISLISDKTKGVGILCRLEAKEEVVTRKVWTIHAIDKIVNREDKVTSFSLALRD